MTTNFYRNSTCRRLLPILALAMLLIPAVSQAQSWTEPVAPDLWHDRLEIGPVEGLTTAWHAAPVRTGIPLGATVQLRVKVPRRFHVSWTGVWETERDGAWSTAEHRFDAVGPHVVSVAWEDPLAPGKRIEEATRLEVEFEVIDVQPTTASSTGVVVSAIHLSQEDGGSSIAALRQDEADPDHYWTSVNRRLKLEADVQPSAFAPLTEVRVDGKPRYHLGTPLSLEIYTAQAHIISVGPVADEKQVRLDTYMVQITSHEPREEIPAGEPLTFTAETFPAGYEEYISWQAVTELGSADPSAGQGPQFTVWFEPTLGDRSQYRGVRADNAKVGGRQPGDQTGVQTAHAGRWCCKTCNYIDPACRDCKAICTGCKRQKPGVPLNCGGAEPVPVDWTDSHIGESTVVLF